MPDIESPSTPSTIAAWNTTGKVSFWQSRRTKELISRGIIHFILIAGALIMVVPFIWIGLDIFQSSGKDLCLPTGMDPPAFCVAKLCGDVDGAALQPILFEEHKNRCAFHDRTAFDLLYGRFCFQRSKI